MLAQVAPVWLGGRVDAGWFERYGERFSDYRLPKVQGERQDLSELVDRDGMTLLDAVDGPILARMTDLTGCYDEWGDLTASQRR